MKAKSVIVIGAGVGGITAATHLAKRGMHVKVLEKNSHPGGRCDHLSRGGHHFDTGPTLFVMPRLYEAEFRALGTSLSERLDLRRVDPTYHLVFDDGNRLVLTSDMKSMREQLESMQPGSYQGFLRYLQEGERHYQLAMDKLITRSFHKASDFFNYENLALILRLKPLTNHYGNMSAYFDDSRLKTAFTFQDIYMGLNPSEAPATFSLLPFTELVHGVWYPKGGMYSIVEALTDLASQAGVEFIFTSAVERIDTDSTRARGVLLADGSRLDADVILANADLPYVYQNLLPRDGISKALSRKQFSSTVISFFWGVDKKYEALGPHTLFLADEYRESFERINRDLDLPVNPILYIHAPARLDPSMAPPGQDTLTSIVPVGHIRDHGEQDWSMLRDKAREHVLHRLRALGITDMQSHIKFEVTYTPPFWRKRYNLMKGSIHGLSHTLNQLTYFRPSNRHLRYKNLYFVGASTHPGTGIPTTMVSGRLVSERIWDELS